MGYLVALDVELLKAQGKGHGINAYQAARIRALAESCQCAPKVRLRDTCSQCSIKLSPQAQGGGEALVLLQVVVEASISKSHWIPFGQLVPVRVAARGSAAALSATVPPA